MRQQIFETALQKILGEIVALDVMLKQDDGYAARQLLRAKRTIAAIEKIAEEALRRDK